MLFLLIEENLSIFTSTNCKEFWPKNSKQTNKQKKNKKETKSPNINTENI